jgi:ketosteroid isomerase-like protein
MSAQENVQVVQRAYEAFSRGDIPAMLNTLTEDVEWFIPGPPQILQYAGQRRGREGVAQFFSLLDGAEEIERFEPKEFLAQGEKVVVLGTYRARVKTTGRIVESDWVQCTYCAMGRFRNFANSVTPLRQ